MLVRAALYPAIAIAFSLTIITAYWGMATVPAARGWAAFLGLLAAGAAALTVTRSTPELGATLGGFGVAVVAYAIGLIVSAALYALFAKPQR